MRPHVVIDLSEYVHDATRRRALNGQFEPGVYQYNEFNITIEGSNHFTQGEVNRDTILIQM